ncbi:MAG: hypothetical protein NPIRA04_35250 [Nitrospirales bacterium]|nr:MAG: hypothetical protein NPIRA04_35250 [Nitrospirales bacterium]
MTIIIRKNLLSRTALLFSLLIGMSSLPVLQSTLAASTYRCEDSSGLTVLTDSPAQLEHCTVLLEESSSNNSGTTSQPKSTIQPMSSKTEPNTLEPNIPQEYPFIDELGQSSQDEQSEAITIPVTSYGGSLLVTVQLNQTREVQLILDTGATMTVLSQDVALDLGLISSSKTQLTTVYTAGGPIQVNVSTVDSIQAGTAQVHDVDVAIHDLPDGQKGIDGLLGMSFLNHFLVTLDTNQGLLHLKPRS